MPRLVILSESLISVPEILMGGIAGKVRKRWCVPKSMDSDLSRLRQRPLKQSHERRVAKQASKQSIEALIVPLLRLM